MASSIVLVEPALPLAISFSVPVTARLMMVLSGLAGNVGSLECLPKANV
jgi:hypothetical protein